VVRYYLDGTVLAHILADGEEFGALREWMVAHEREAVTSVVARWEATEEIAGPVEGRKAQLREFIAGLPQVPVSGKAVEVGSYAVAAVRPYAALHVGIAAAHEEITVVVTYDHDVATASRLYGLEVVSPGWDSNWYVE
jgi:predicted nucleic acid-binding protein